MDWSFTGRVSGKKMRSHPWAKSTNGTNLRIEMNNANKK
jgi:hypothetical protein